MFVVAHSGPAMSHFDLSTFSVAEIEELLRRKQQEEAQRASRLTQEMAQIDQEIADVNRRLGALMERRRLMESQLATIPPAVEFGVAFDEALASPVQKGDGTINIAKTAEKHGLDYRKFLKFVKSRGITLRRGH